MPKTFYLGSMATGIAMALAITSAASAAPIFFVNNPSANSVDWTNSVIALNGAINANVNFDTHPLGALQTGRYSASDGVEFAISGSIGAVVDGFGPGQGATGGAIGGEGNHESSHHLTAGIEDSGTNTSVLTISFDAPVLGVGLFTFDFIARKTRVNIKIEAFDGIAGTGNSLGMASAVENNFQRNHLYFMGIVDDANTIRSFKFTHFSRRFGDVIGIDDIMFANSVESISPDPFDPSGPDNPEVVYVTEPANFTIFALGLAGLGFVRRRRAA